MRMIEIELRSRLRELAQKPHGGIKHAELGSIFGRSMMAGLDGQRMYYEIMKEMYDDQQTYAKEQETKELQKTGFHQCPHCKATFSTEKALNGHGPERCRRRLQE